MEKLAENDLNYFYPGHSTAAGPLIWFSGFRGEDFKISNNQKHECPVVAMFVNAYGQNLSSDPQFKILLNRLSSIILLKTYILIS